jgi:plastocyanin
MRFNAKVFLFVSLVVSSLCSSAFATDYTVKTGDSYGGGMFFDPPTLNINPGDRVRWENQSIYQHTATSGENCTPNGTFNSGILNPGGISAYVTFASAGEFAYYCRFHCEMGMVGSINVTAPVRTRQGTWGSVKALYAKIVSLF